ncbi:hypothetical protein SDC49_20180 [Lactobacillus sp. R2/2]|nr:hypothetical protein [Lactobacillus sp. R2/2]
MRINIYLFSTNLVKELENDIAEFVNPEVCVYWKVMENNQEFILTIFWLTI